ncbi:MAG: pyridoxal phosphate-dependent aminotransferase [Nitrospinae bacterium]|nr:pyridoxal phosphate-dependent aminotransferase [Nitrospinota bacterium]
MVKLADRMSLIKPSPTLAITAKAKAMKAEGIDVVGFGAGEPDFDTPDFVKEAAITALREGKTKYTDAPGMPELRDALCAFYKRTEGLDYTRAESIISVGGKHALYNILMALLSPGDEVIIPTPYWVSYPDMTLLAGGTPVFLKTEEKNGFRFTADELDALVTPRTKAVVVNSPSNPSGAVYDVATLKGIAAVAKKRNIIVIWDEIYKDVYYGEGRLRSLPHYDPEVKPLTLICSGLAKNFSMTGWRIGWVLGDKEIVTAMSTIQGQSTSNPVTFAQYGALAALNAGTGHIGPWLAEFRARRDALLAAFERIPGISCLKPEGAFYVFPNISGWYGKKWSGGVIKDSYDATTFLLQEARVAVVPGDPFGAPDNIRLSYALGMDEIQKGIDRMAAAAASLK